MRRPFANLVLRLLLVALVLAGPAPAQASPTTYPGLVSLAGAPLPVYCTPGAEARARAMATRCAEAEAYLRQPARLGFTPRVTLLVLNPADWRRFAANPVYGMPHTAGYSVLVVAAEDNALWRDMVPPLDKLPPTVRAQVEATYRPPGGGPLSMQPMFDLLALHELGHAFFRQAHRSRPRWWLDELFANLLLHTYVAERRPELLPVLEVFPQLVVDGTDRSKLRFTSLADFETQYGRMEVNQPVNYGWYQCRLHRAAARIYQAGGAAALGKMWRALPTNGPTALSDADLAARLQHRVGPELAQVLANW